MRETQKELSFAGGLNVTTPPTEIKDNELTVCNNFFIDDQGVLKKRGSFLTNPVSGITAGSYSFLGVDYTQQKYIITSSAETYLIQSGIATAFTGEPSNPASWMLHINGATYVGYVFSQVRKLTGAAVGAAIASSPSGRTAVWHKQRVFADVFATAGRIAVSKSTDPEVWASPDGGTIDIGVEDKEKITGFASLGDLLLVFKQKSIWAVYVQGDTPSQWAIRRISNDIGAVSASAITVYKNEAYFFSEGHGVYKTNGQSIIELSRKIWKWPEILYTFTPTHVNMVFYRDTLIFTLENNNLDPALRQRFFYNPALDAWSTWDDTVYMDLMLISGGMASVSYPILYGIESNVIYTLDYHREPEWYDTYLTDIENLFNPMSSSGTASFQTKQFTTNLDEYLRLKWLGLEYKAHASPEFKIIGDDIDGAAVSPGFNSSLIKSYRMPGAGRRRKFALRCDHSATSPFEFYRANVRVSSHAPLAASGTP